MKRFEPPFSGKMRSKKVFHYYYHYVRTSLYPNTYMFPKLHIPTALCAHSSIFEQLHVPTVLRFHSSIFEQLYVPIALCWHSSVFENYIKFPQLCSADFETRVKIRVGGIIKLWEHGRVLLTEIHFVTDRSEGR